jgi:hypothetical protein
LNTGDVIYIKQVSYTDHPKYHLVLSIAQDLFFVINSDINSTVALNPEFKICQVKLSKLPNNLFMSENESYIACHQFAPIYTIEVDKQIKEGKAENKGKLDKETLKLVRDTVLNHRPKTISYSEMVEIVKCIDAVL